MRIKKGKFLTVPLVQLSACLLKEGKRRTPLTLQLMENARTMMNSAYTTTSRHLKAQRCNSYRGQGAFAKFQTRGLRRLRPREYSPTRSELESEYLHREASWPQVHERL